MLQKKNNTYTYMIVYRLFIDYIQKLHKLKFFKRLYFIILNKSKIELFLSYSFIVHIFIVPLYQIFCVLN